LLEIIYSLFGDDPVLEEPFLEGIADIFREGSFSFIYDMFYLLEEGDKYLERVLEKI